jgi:type VI secretion system protein ImpM
VWTMTGSGSGVFGKHPGQADFVCAGASEFLRAALDQWFEEATEGVRRERLVLPDGATGFVLAPTAASGSVFAGAFAPSTDAVGRSFPLIVFSSFEAASASPASLHAQASSFVDAATALLAEAPVLSPADLGARAQDLRLPPAQGGIDPLVETASAEALVSALGGAGQLAYAVSTCLAACDQAVKTAAAGSSGVIATDAAAPDGAARSFWSRLVASRLGKLRPSLVWTQGGAGRLLLTLGPPPPLVLSFLSNPQHRASRFWPLRTDVTSAIDGALGALTPEQRRVVEDPSPTWGALLAAFG